MVVSVEFLGAQRALTRTGRVAVPLRGRGRVKDVFGYIMGCYPELPLDEKGLVVTVNSKVSTIDHVLDPDDRVAFLPHIGGG